jgi:hypothetical protein
MALAVFIGAGLARHGMAWQGWMDGYSNQGARRLELHIPLSVYSSRSIHIVMFYKWHSGPPLSTSLPLLAHVPMSISGDMDIVPTFLTKLHLLAADVSFKVHRSSKLAI